MTVDLNHTITAEMAYDLAVSQKVCVRPMLRRVHDRQDGTEDVVAGDVNPTWPHRDGGGWPQLSCIRGLGLLGQPQKMQVGSRSSSLSRSSTRFDGASRS